MSCNVIKEYTDNTKKNYLNYTKKVMGKYFDKTLFEEYINTYIAIRYYNQEKEVKSTLEANLNYYLNNTYEITPTKASKFMLELFKMFYYLDGVKNFKAKEDVKAYIRELNQIRVEKLNIHEEDFIREFSKLIRENEKKRLDFLNALETEDFYLERKKRNIQNVYNITLKHHVEIPDIFSNKAIEKVYNSGLIMEDRLFIEYYLVSKELLETIIEGTNQKEYLVEFFPSIMEKKEKTKKLFNIIDNDIAKERITLKITYQDFINNKDEIYDYIKDGFSFGVILDSYFKENPKPLSSLDIFHYIILPDASYKNISLASKRNVIEE